jgi:hypothetical protein
MRAPPPVKNHRFLDHLCCQHFFGDFFGAKRGVSPLVCLLVRACLRRRASVCCMRVRGWQQHEARVHVTCTICPATRANAVRCTVCARYSDARALTRVCACRRRMHSIDFWEAENRSPLFCSMFRGARGIRWHVLRW